MEVRAVARLDGEMKVKGVYFEGADIGASFWKQSSRSLPALLWFQQKKG